MPIQRMQQRRGTSAEGTSVNPVLAAGEIGVETDTGAMKIGDGVTPWNDLEYYPPTDLLETMVAEVVEGRFKVLAVDTVQFWGHSYLAGVSPSSDFIAGVNDAASIAATRLGLPPDNRAVSGSQLHSFFTDGAWNAVYSNRVPPGRFAPSDALHVTMWGYNDLSTLTTWTEAGLAPYTHAYRAVISRLRAEWVAEENSPTVVLGGAGAWTNAGDFNASGGAYRWNNTVGGTIAITTPASFPGGTIAAMFFAVAGSGGATISTTIGPDTYAVDTTEAASAVTNVPVVLRIPGLAPGVQTITLTVTAASGTRGCAFDGWAWEPAATEGATVMLVEQPKPLDYVGPSRDVGVDLINQIMADLAVEFGAKVQVVETGSMDALPLAWQIGDIHPTTYGHQLLGELIAESILAQVVPAEAGAVVTRAYFGPFPEAPYVIPAGTRVLKIAACGGGGGGGAGRRGATGTARPGGGGGGGGGFSEVELVMSQYSGSRTLWVAAGGGGAAGAGQTVNDTNGAVGTAGSASYVSTAAATPGQALCHAGGGAGGHAGGASGAGTGGGGTGRWIGGTGGDGPTAGTAGNPATLTSSAAQGGGGGGGATAANVSSGGGASQAPPGMNPTAAAAGGTSGNPGGVPPGDFGFVGVRPGGGGGGGGFQGAGGRGVLAGGGGGGGGSTNGTTSGAGGAGGQGWVTITAVF